MEKKGCVTFGLLSLLAGFGLTMEQLWVKSCSVGRKSRDVPHRIREMISPMRFRSSTSFPYLILTIREGRIETFGFGGDPNVPVLGLNLRIFLGWIIMGAFGVAVLADKT